MYTSSRPRNKGNFRGLLEVYQEAGGYLDEFCAAFGEDRRELLAERFWVLTPDGENLYRRLYTSV